MRFFKFKNSVNWKYALGEIALLFIGINLAIWFNNWNSYKQIEKSKNIAITKIKEEILSNEIELKKSYQNIISIKNALLDLKKLKKGKDNPEVFPQEMKAFQKKYSEIYKISDSVKTKDEKYIYNGSTLINLEIFELSSIAWETTKTINVLNEFGYECLYELESGYNLQKRTLLEMDKVANALQKRDLYNLLSSLEFLEQYEEQLKEDYKNILEKIEDCK